MKPEPKLEASLQIRATLAAVARSSKLGFCFSELERGTGVGLAGVVFGASVEHTPHALNALDGAHLCPVGLEAEVPQLAELGGAAGLVLESQEPRALLFILGLTKLAHRMIDGSGLAAPEIALVFVASSVRKHEKPDQRDGTQRDERGGGPIWTRSPA